MKSKQKRNQRWIDSIAVLFAALDNAGGSA